MLDVNAYDSLHILCLRIDFIYLHIDRIFYIRFHTMVGYHSKILSG